MQKINTKTRSHGSQRLVLFLNLELADLWKFPKDIIYNVGPILSDSPLAGLEWIPESITLLRDSDY